MNDAGERGALVPVDEADGVGGGRRVRPPGAGHEAARDRRLARRAAWRERPRKICGQKDTPTADGARTRRGPGGLLRGFLSARGPRGFHPLGHRLLLFGRHRTALPRRCGVGRGLRYRGGRSRRPPRGGTPSCGLRRGGGAKDLIDIVQRLDFRLQALNFTLPVGDCLCYDTHELPRAASSVGRHAQGSAERAPMGSDSSPRRVRRPGRSRRRAASPPRRRPARRGRRTPPPCFRSPRALHPASGTLQLQSRRGGRGTASA